MWHDELDLEDLLMPAYSATHQPAAAVAAPPPWRPAAAAIPPTGNGGGAAVGIQPPVVAPVQQAAQVVAVPIFDDDDATQLRLANHLLRWEGDDPLRAYLKEQAVKHAPFVAEAICESIPQSLVQVSESNGVQ